jgi:hypothetical protein
MFRLRFSHRPQLDGSYVSICTRCFATVERSHNEAALEAAEQQHVCDKYVLTRIAREYEQARTEG